MISIALLISILAVEGQPVSLPAGTRIEAKLESTVNTGNSGIGDAIAAVVSASVHDAAGTIAIPKGSRLIGRIETITPASGDVAGRLRLVFSDIQLPSGVLTSTWITDSFSARPSNNNLRHGLFMAIGAAAGALIGGKAARTSGIIGGTLVGFLIASNSGQGKLPDLHLKRGHTLYLRLGEDLTLQPQQ